jgi:WD40 repeat protein
VEVGDLGSALIAAVSQSGEKRMPPEGEMLGAAQIKVLKTWIEGGLLENQSSSARKTAKPKFETTLRSNPAARPDGPPPMPQHLLLQPPVVTARPAAVHAIAASPWAPFLAITGQRQILLHHTESLELIGILPFPEGEPVSLAFTPDARYLIVGGGIGGKSGVTVTFDISSGERLLTAAKEFDTVLAADIRPGFDIVATGGPSRLLKTWNTETGELAQSIKKHTDWITALDLSADGVLLASGDRNGGLWVWESQTLNEYHTLRGHQAAITAAVFRADSNILATSSEDGTLRFWEMNGGSEVKKIDAHPGGVTALALAQDGSSVTAGRDLKVKLWKADFSHARDLAKDLPALPTAVALDSDAKRAFVADSQGLIRVYQTSDSALLGEIRCNPPTIETRLQSLALELLKQTPDPSLQARFQYWFSAAINTKAIEPLIRSWD